MVQVGWLPWVRRVGMGFLGSTNGLLSMPNGFSPSWNRAYRVLTGFLELFGGLNMISMAFNGWTWFRLVDFLVRWVFMGFLGFINESLGTPNRFQRVYRVWTERTGFFTWFPWVWMGSHCSGRLILWFVGFWWVSWVSLTACLAAPTGFEGFFYPWWLWFVGFVGFQRVHRAIMGLPDDSTWINLINSNGTFIK